MVGDGHDLASCYGFFPSRDRLRGSGWRATRWGAVDDRAGEKFVPAQADAMTGASGMLDPQKLPLALRGLVQGDSRSPIFEYLTAVLQHCIDRARFQRSDIPASQNESRHDRRARGCWG